MSLLIIRRIKALFVFLLAWPLFYWVVFNYNNPSISISGIAWSFLFASIVVFRFFFGPLGRVRVISTESDSLRNLEIFLGNSHSFDFLPLSLDDSDKMKALAKSGAGVYDYGAHELALKAIDQLNGRIFSEFQFRSFEAKGSGYLYLFEGADSTTPFYLMYRPQGLKRKMSFGWSDLEGSHWRYRILGVWAKLFGYRVMGRTQLKELVPMLEKEIPGFQSGISLTSLGSSRLLLTKDPVSPEVIERLSSLKFQQ